MSQNWVRGSCHPALRLRSPSVCVYNEIEKSAHVLPLHPYIGDLTNSKNDLPNVAMLGHDVLSTSKFIYGSACEWVLLLGLGELHAMELLLVWKTWRGIASSFSEDAKLTESMANDAETLTDVVNLIITNADSDMTAEADAADLNASQLSFPLLCLCKSLTGGKRKQDIIISNSTAQRKFDED